MFLSVKSLSKKYDLSESTVRRIYGRLKESGEYKKDFIRLGKSIRINEKSFLREAEKWQ